MNNVELTLNDDGKGAFNIIVDNQQAGAMEVGIKGKLLTVYHTEVDEEFEGKGYGQTLLGAMADYAREHDLKVVPLCSFVHTTFRRHPKDYEDIWQK